jgi:hypothetical protein
MTTSHPDSFHSAATLTSGSTTVSLLPPEGAGRERREG